MHLSRSIDARQVQRLIPCNRVNCIASFQKGRRELLFDDSYPDGNGSTDFESADRGFTVTLKSMTVTDGQHCTWNRYRQIDGAPNTQIPDIQIAPVRSGGMRVTCCRWACAYDTDHWTNRNPDALIKLNYSILDIKDATVIAVNVIYAFAQTDAHHAMFIWYDIENFDF